MKNLKILFFFLVLTIVACSDKNDLSPTLAASISFTANGTAFKWIENSEPYSEDRLSIDIVQAYGGGSYSFTAGNTYFHHSLPPRLVSFRIYTTTLATNMPYTANKDSDPFIVVVSTPVASHASHTYMASHADDFGTITITKIHENRADGIFTARLTHVEDSSKVDITKGKFENVEIQE